MCALVISSVFASGAVSGPATTSKLNATARLRWIAAVLGGAAGLALTGCGILPSVPLHPTEGNSLSGSVYGGQQPIAGAVISLMAPGTTGYGSASSVIVSTTTDSSGSFTLPRPYACPVNSGLVYLTSTGGNAGGGVNASIAEAAILGPCSNLTASTFVIINEATTVAAAYVLAPFASVTAGGTGVGTSATNLQGLTNAAGSAGNLVSYVTGQAHAAGDFPGIVPPTAEINTLADILAACVNESQPAGPSGRCASLFSAATPPGGTAPKDTFQAALDIAQHPGQNTGTLFALAAPSGPFQPTLTSAPGDFSVALGFNGGAINVGGGTIGVAIDAAGDAWITTGQGGKAHTLTEISPAGVYLSGATVATTTGFGSSVLNGPIGLAIDQNGAVFVDNNGGGNVLKFNPNGTLQNTINATSFNGPNAIAIDGGGSPWIANFGGNKVTKITTAGVEASNSPFTVGSGGVDIDAGPLAIWETDYQSNFISRIDLTSFAVTNVTIGGPSGGVAIDHANNVWIAVTGNGNVFEFSNTGGGISPFGGYVLPNGVVQNIMIDGLGNAFAGAATTGSAVGGLAEFSNAGVLLSPASGFSGSGFIPVVPQPPDGIDIDGSGNVWIAGTPNGTVLPSYVAEVIGIAAPVVTPRSVATTGNVRGVRP